MFRRRSRLEIILSTLSAIRGGKEKPTNIAYATNTSWKRNQIILSDLVGQGFIEVRMIPRNGSLQRRYTITEKGVNVLDYFKKVNEILPTQP